MLVEWVEGWSYNEGEDLLRNEERVVMRYNSVLDLHTHTLVSGHAYCSLREMAKAASREGTGGSGDYGACACYAGNLS